MISVAGNMRPLPVRPIDTIAPGTPAPLPHRRPVRRMHPLPMPRPDAVDLTEALRATAYQRMLDRIGVKHPFPVADPTK